MIFLDLGSTRGGEIRQALNAGFEVHAFEPNLNFKYALEAFEKTATINYAAAWDKDGTEKLWGMAAAWEDELGNSLIKEKQNVSKERFMEVPTINLGRYLKELDKDIDVMKINTEGAEYIILESILDNFDPKRIKRWFVEDHKNYIPDESWRAHKDKILERLKNENIILEDWHGDSLRAL